MAMRTAELENKDRQMLEQAIAEAVKGGWMLHGGVRECTQTLDGICSIKYVQSIYKFD